jgi:hypothetical protein
LKTYTLNNLLVGGTQLIFQEEVIFEQRKIRRNPEKSFTKRDENDNLNNRVGIEMNQLNLVVVK